MAERPNDVFFRVPTRTKRARRGRERLGGDTHLREGGTAPGVVDDVSDNTLDVTMALGVVLSGGRGWVGVSPAFGDGVSTRAREAKKTRARRAVQPPARPRRDVLNAREGGNRFHTRHACHATSGAPGERACGPRGGVVRRRKPSGGPASRSRTMADDGRERTDWRCLASPLRLEVFEVKTDPAPLRCPRMIRPILDDG